MPVLRFHGNSSSVMFQQHGMRIRGDDRALYVEEGTNTLLSIEGTTDPDSSPASVLEPDSSPAPVLDPDSSPGPAQTPDPEPGHWVQRGTTIDGESVGDYSGHAIALTEDGGVLAIGSVEADGAGHVRVFEWSGSAWIQRGSTIVGESNMDFSGWSVALSQDGDVIAIGAIEAKADDGSRRGHVRVFDWDDMTWNQRGGDIDGTSSGHRQGFSVSLSTHGEVLAVGEIFNDAGVVRVYEWSNSAWVQRGLDMSGESTGDGFGFSVELSADGNKLVVGAVDADDGAGHVRVYEWSGASWGQIGSDLGGERTGDNSGYWVQISADGTVVAIGAIDAVDDSGAQTGHVRVYAWNGVVWTQRGSDIDGESHGDRSGWSVALSQDGGVVAIGAIHAVNGNDIDALTGHTRVYVWDGAVWVQRGVDIDGVTHQDRHGSSVALSADGTIVAIGATDVADHSGHVRVYTFEVPNP